MSFSPHRPLSWGLALAVLAPLAWSCIDGDDLVGAICDSNADCWSDQQCVRTPEQMEEDNKPGQCQVSSQCGEGSQDGCACTPDVSGNALECEGPLLETDKDAEDCLCCDCRHGDIIAGSKAKPGDRRAFREGDTCVCCPSENEAFFEVSGYEDGECIYDCDPCGDGSEPNQQDCACPGG